MKDFINKIMEIGIGFDQSCSEIERGKWIAEAEKEYRLHFKKLNQMKLNESTRQQNKMEVVIFKDKNWKEIPEQDNPAFDYQYDDPRLQERIIGRNNPCILVHKTLPYRQGGVGENGYTVTEVPMNGDVIGRGLVWKLEYAEMFASALANER